jgi:hypothetical protein
VGVRSIERTVKPYENGRIAEGAAPDGDWRGTTGPAEFVDNYVIYIGYIGARLFVYILVALDLNLLTG